MAHFALIGSADAVEDLIVVSNDDCGGGEFPLSEALGQAFIAELGLEGEWRQTSYNNSFRGTYAGIGYRYDRLSDLFVAPQVAEPSEASEE
jgi:hypothetical protein